MSKKGVVDGYNILLTKESEVRGGRFFEIQGLSDKDLYNAHLWFHHNGYDYVIKKNHTDFNEDKINEILNQNKDKDEH